MLNAAASQAAKQSGMQLAMDFAGDAWRVRVLDELRAWCASKLALGDTEMAMEQFRSVAVNTAPRHQAWGALALAACKAKIIAPKEHADGSAVYRAAESVRTHGHPVRVYRIVSASSSMEGDKSPSFDHRADAGAVHTQNGTERVGEGRHSHCEEVTHGR